jgi:hypothetical protein
MIVVELTIILFSVKPSKFEITKFISLFCHRDTDIRTNPNFNQDEDFENFSYNTSLFSGFVFK